MNKVGQKLKWFRWSGNPSTYSAFVNDCEEVKNILGAAEELDLTVMRGYLKPDPDEDR